MELLDGKKLSEEILENLKKEVKKRRLKLKLAVVLVGNDVPSEIYVKQKKQAAKKIGVGFRLHRFNETIKTDDLEREIKKIGGNFLISGMVVQLPLPETIDTNRILKAIPASKDVDVLSAAGFKKFSEGRSSIFPPTVRAVELLLEKYRIRLKNKKIVIVGGGRLVGEPLAAWLKLKKMKFSVLDKKTKNIQDKIGRADILVVGTGQDKIIKGDMVKEGAVVVDFAKDVDFKSVSKKASYITPVPGGVGPMTVACLLENLVKISE